MNPQTRKVAPKGHGGRKMSSAGMLGLGPQTPIRSSTKVSALLLQHSISNRLLVEELKTLHNHFNEILESCTPSAQVDLAKFLESKVNLNKIWLKTYGIPWNPTEENLKILSENFLQCGMLHIRAESIGRPNPQKVMRRFAVSVITDICEFLALVNIGLCFHWNEISAGWILSACVILERVLQTTACLAMEGKSFTSIITSLLGVKTFLTSYFISCEGLLGKVEGSKLDLFQTRIIHKGINGLFVSTPQVVLNSYMIFSKLKKESDINTEMQIQVFFILAVSLSFGISQTNLVQEHQRQKCEIGFYKSMTQIHPVDGDDFGIVITKTLWNVLHFIMVTFGLGALIAKAPVALWISLVAGFFIVLFIIRCIINQVEFRFYKRTNLSKFGTAILSLHFIILAILGVGLMPLSFMRWHNILGPTVFAVGWISSFLMSCVSVLYLSSNVILWATFGCLSFVYVVVVYVYFQLLKPGAWKTFIWSDENWKDKLRNEWWTSTYKSGIWEDIHLIGDKDAHYAGMVLYYSETDLPWDKLTAWLKEKKTTFRNTPPTWLSIEWLNLLPKNVIADVWNIAEYQDLLDRICEVEERFQRWSVAKTRVVTDKRKPSKTKMDIIVGEDNDVPNATDLKSDKYLDKNSNTKIHSKNKGNNYSLKNKSSVADPKGMTNDGKNSDVMPEKDEDSFPNIMPNNGPEEEHEEDERTKAIRKDIAKHMRRRSSLGGSRGILPLQNNQKEEDDIPSVLKELFEKAETMQMNEIQEASKEAVDGELFAILRGPKKDATGEDIMLTILKGFLRQQNKQVKKKNINEGVPRILLAAFFELFDEVSDIILAILYSTSAGNYQWAGHLMLAFIVLNRLMQGICSLSVGESFWRVCEGLLGIKCITDTYRMIRDGPMAMSGKMNLASVRNFSIAIGMSCESLPQMILQVFIFSSAFKSKNFDTGILIAQATSVLFSCISVGLSLASLYVDIALTMTIPGKERYKSLKFIPRNDKFRQTVVLISMTMIMALHLLLSTFGFGALFSYAPIPGKRVWKEDGELERLIEKVAEVTQQAATSN
eukprot:g58.t1